MNFLDLKVGDRVDLTTTFFTARDKAHLYLLDNDFPKINGSIIYHCGPIIKNNEIIAAGPTSSSRFNIYTPKLIEKYGIKAFIGKGGFDYSVLEALKGKAVYFSAVGGASLVYAKKMKIINIYNKEFGMAEAIYEVEVKNFPVVVTMDSHGNSLYEKIIKSSKALLYPN